jgi:phage repressor protein C with HTH and peptisase S24 domain|uniref:S24 family peptidase n=1 Tax=Alloprevotella sp. TaxID=1872471 RepID=UPI003FEEA4B5
MQGKEQNISPIKQRILFFAGTLGISKRDFYAKIGVSRGTLESKTGITEDVITKFFATYPEVSVEWLMTGEGEMLKNSPSCKEKKQENSDLVEKIPEVSYNSAIGKPYYDVDFLGGFNEIVNSQVSIPTNNIVIQGFEKADFWCNVTGHSMEPKINHGDIIALHKCTLKDIQYGEIYAVVLDTLRTIKILRRSTDPKKLRFVPINTTDYDEQEYPIERIMNVYEVIGSISKFF